MIRYRTDAITVSRIVSRMIINLHFDTIVVSLIILWRDMLHILFELLTDEMIIDFEFFFRRLIRINRRQLTVSFKDFALIVLKIANQVCISHCFFDFICGDNTLFRKTQTNSIIIWVVHVPAIFVIIMCAAGSKKLVTLNCLLGIYVVTVEADNHLNAVLFRKLQYTSVQLLLLIGIVCLDFKHEVILEIVMQLADQLLDILRLIMPESNTGRCDKYIVRR